MELRIVQNQDVQSQAKQIVREYLSSRTALRDSISSIETSVGWLACDNDEGQDSGIYLFLGESGFSEVFTDTAFGWSEPAAKPQTEQEAKTTVTNLFRSIGADQRMIKSLQFSPVVRVFLRPKLINRHVGLPIVFYCTRDGKVLAIRRAHKEALERAGGIH